MTGWNRIAGLLQRRTSGGSLIPEIDGLRAIAILPVVVLHATSSYDRLVLGREPESDFISRLLYSGEMGVPIFFVISGFILALPFARHHLLHARAPGLGHYFLRRITRLEPPYLLALTSVYVLQAFLRDGWDWAHFLSSCLYLHNIVYRGPDPVFAVTWSLAVEVQFYIVAPALASIFALPSTAARRVILGAAAIVMNLVFGVESPIDGPNLLHQFGYFAGGMLVADLFIARERAHQQGALRPKSKIRSLAWDVVALVSLTGVFLLHALDIRLAVQAVWILPIGFWAVLSGRFTNALFRFPPVYLIGGMCYSIYLWHSYAVALVARYVASQCPGLDAWIAIGLSCAFGIFVGAVAFVLVERPTMDPAWPRRLWQAIGRSILGRRPPAT